MSPTFCIEPDLGIKWGYDGDHSSCILCILKGDINLCHSPQNVIMLLVNSLAGGEVGSEASIWPFQQ